MTNDNLAICNHSATICPRMSPTSESTGDGLLCSKICGGSKGLTDVSQILTKSGRGMGLT